MFLRDKWYRYIICRSCTESVTHKMACLQVSCHKESHRGHHGRYTHYSLIESAAARSSTTCSSCRQPPPPPPLTVTMRVMQLHQPTLSPYVMMEPIPSSLLQTPVDVIPLHHL